MPPRPSRSCVKKSLAATAEARPRAPRSRLCFLDLPGDAILTICSYLPQNDVSCSLRLSCKTLRGVLSYPGHRIVRFSEPVLPEAFAWAVQNGIPFLDKNCRAGRGVKALEGLTDDEKICLSSLVAGTGSLTNLKMLHDVAFCPGTCSAPRAAAFGGHLHVLQWQQSQGVCMGCFRVQHAIGCAAPLPILQWYDGLEEADPNLLLCTACEDADAARRNDKLSYLYGTHGAAVISNRAINTAVRRGDLATAEWLAARGAPIDSVTFAAAVGGGSVAAATWVADKLSSLPRLFNCLYEAARGGHVSTMEWLVRQVPGQWPSPHRWKLSLTAAARNGHLDSVMWLLQRPPVEEAGDQAEPLAAAAEGGVLGAAASAGQAVPAGLAQEALEAAAEGGHCEVMQVLMERGGAVASADAMCLAARGSSTWTADLLAASSPTTATGSAKTAASAARGAAGGRCARRLAAMQLLLHHAMGGAAAAAAAAGGGADASTSAAPSTSASAAVAGEASDSSRISSNSNTGSGLGTSSSILRPEAYVAAVLSAGWCSCCCHGAGGNGGSGAGGSGGSSSSSSPGSSGSGSDSGGGGPCVLARNCLSGLQWLEAQGCRLGGPAALEEAAVAAALVGSRVRLEWLRARGAGWSAAMLAAAASSGCLRLVQWMAAEGCPMGRRGDALLAAAANGDIAMLAALRRLGCPWSADVLPRAIHSFLRLTQAGTGGAAAGAPSSSSSSSQAWRSRVFVVQASLETLQWMVRNGCPATKQAYDLARRLERTDVVDWLKSLGVGRR